MKGGVSYFKKKNQVLAALPRDSDGIFSQWIWLYR